MPEVHPDKYWSTGKRSSENVTVKVYECSGRVVINIDTAMFSTLTEDEWVEMNGYIEKERKRIYAERRPKRKKRR